MRERIQGEHQPSEIVNLINPMYTRRVREFTSVCEKKLPETPVTIPRAQVDFIRRMVSDEMEELLKAEDLVDQADALVDAIYYLCDSAVRHGINLDSLFEIVHEANMKKVVNGKILRRKDGKILKPRDWRDPRPLLIEEIERQRREKSF